MRDSVSGPGVKAPGEGRCLFQLAERGVLEHPYGHDGQQFAGRAQLHELPLGRIQQLGRAYLVALQCPRHGRGHVALRDSDQLAHRLVQLACLPPGSAPKCGPGRAT